MPTVIPNGGGDDITGSEVLAHGAATRAFWNQYNQTFSEPGRGGMAPPEVQVVNAVEEKIDLIAQGWVDSGGPGGYQRAVSREILYRAALLQGDLASSVKQWARPGRERALLEMFSVLTKALVERDRLLLELRERLNVSPY